MSANIGILAIANAWAASGAAQQAQASQLAQQGQVNQSIANQNISKSGPGNWGGSPFGGNTWGNQTQTISRANALQTAVRGLSSIMTHPLIGAQYWIPQNLGYDDEMRALIYFVEFGEGTIPELLPVILKKLIAKIPTDDPVLIQVGALFQYVPGTIEELKEKQDV